MHLDDYQHAALRTINPALDQRERLLDAAAGMAEEAGEVLGLIRKHLFQDRPLDRERLTKELGDVLWCLAVTAQSAGIDLEAVAEANIAKLKARYPDGFDSARAASGDATSG